jgi:hypothetical protein
MSASHARRMTTASEGADGELLADNMFLVFAHM